MPKALLIDLDDTLLDDRRAMAAAVLQLRERHRLAPHEPDDAVARRWDARGCAAAEGQSISHAARAAGCAA